MDIEEIEKQSFAFIDRHIDATFDEVPEDLFKIWHISVPIGEYLKRDYEHQYEYRIYRYALKKYQETKGITIPEDKIIPVFKTFQLMLSIPFIRKYRFPRETAFRIFDFQFYLTLL